MPCMPPMLFDERPAAAVAPSICYADSSRHQRELVMRYCPRRRESQRSKYSQTSSSKPIMTPATHIITNGITL